MTRSLVQIARTLPFHGHGGMEAHSWELARAFVRRGWEVEVLTTSFEDRTFVKDIEGIRVHSLRHLPLNRDEVPNWRWWHRFAARVRDYAVAHRIDAEVAHSESAYGHALFRALRTVRSPIRRIMTLHGTTLQTYRETGRPRLLERVRPWHPRAIGQWLYVRQRRWRERRFEFPSAERMVTVSPMLAEHLVADYGQPRERIEVIANGVDIGDADVNREAIRMELGVPRDARLILYLGRLERAKRVELLIRHLSARPHDRLVVAGSGPHEKALRAEAQRLSNPGAARFLGPVSEEVRRKLYLAADVFALASDSEGQPITILEALASGTPVYARRPWVPAELASLVASGDDVTQGIDAAAAKTDSTRQAAPRIRREYSWDKVAERYEAVFQRAKP